MHVAAERVAPGLCGFYSLALAPGGLLFALASRVASDDGFSLLALDALSLQTRFTVGQDVLGLGWCRGQVPSLAVVGEEVFTAMNSMSFSRYADDNSDDDFAALHDSSIRVLSLAGELRRTIAADGWLEPSKLACVEGRLCLIERKDYDDERYEGDTAGRRVITLTPEGAVLQIYTAPHDGGGMCHFDGKLMVSYPKARKLVALHV